VNPLQDLGGSNDPALVTTTRISACPNIAAENRRNSNVLVVSTLDGKVTALDPSEEGRMLWSVDTKPGDMVSSTIRFVICF
jgi:outer membrane protein assembly factor BamB